MTIDKSKLCKTTSINNNCGLNCLTHFLYDKLQKGEAQKWFSQDPVYLGLLKSFNEYYALNSSTSLNDLEKLLNNFPAATDREIIFAPVLRKYLGEIISLEAAHLWEFEGTSAVTEYLSTGKIEGTTAPLIKSNLTFFNALKKTYDDSLTKMNQAPEINERTKAQQQLKAKNIAEQNMTEEKILDQVNFNRRNLLEDLLQERARLHWLKEGCKNYGTYLGDLSNSTEVSSEHLELFCAKLGIGLEVYTRNNDDSITMPQGNYKWLMKVFNYGAHWEYEEPNLDSNKVKQHNLDYDNLDYMHPHISGKQQFTVQSHLDDDTKSIVMATVMNIMDSGIPAPTNVIPKVTKEKPIDVPYTPKSQKSSQIVEKPQPSNGPLPEKASFTPVKSNRSQTESPVFNPIRSSPVRNNENVPGEGKASSMPEPLAIKEYDRLYKLIEQNWDWDKNNSIEDVRIHAETISRLKPLMQRMGQNLTNDHIKWLEENHTKTELESVVNKPRKL